VIVDEAQSLERNVLLTMLSRIGQNSRVVLTHDIAQRDNLRIGRYDGIASVVEALKEHELCAHVTLQRSGRSKGAELVPHVLLQPALWSSAARIPCPVLLAPASRSHWRSARRRHRSRYLRRTHGGDPSSGGPGRLSPVDLRRARPPDDEGMARISLR